MHLWGKGDTACSELTENLQKSYAGRGKVDTMHNGCAVRARKCARAEWVRARNSGAMQFLAQRRPERKFVRYEVPPCELRVCKADRGRRKLESQHPIEERTVY